MIGAWSSPVIVAAAVHQHTHHSHVAHGAIHHPGTHCRMHITVAAEAGIIADVDIPAVNSRGLRDV